VLRVTLNYAVDFRGTVGGRPKKIFRETAHVFLDGALLTPERAANLLGGLPAHVRLKQHLQHKLARSSAGSHKKLSAISLP
jgi:hypothetical protein